ncbi:MAG: tetratricopeptide repeat protein [Legionellaceae bacterium]|nr:tetratricopeptide repeat protein [Legionellaceae bacterium]
MPSENFKHIVNRAMNWHKEGNYRAAQNGYRLALKIQPEHSHLLRLYGMTFYQQGELKAAIQCYSRAVAAQPANADAWRYLGMAYREVGQYQDALDAYEKAISYRRNYPEAFRNLGNALAAMKRNEEAVAAFREALRLKPSYADAYSNLGTVLEKQKKLDEAIVQHQKAIELMPTRAPFYNNLGHALLQKGQFRLAISAFCKAVKRNADYAIAWSNLGIAFSALDKMEHAANAFAKACASDKKNALCQRNLAIFFQQTGQYDKALQVYEDLRQMEPEAMDPYFNIADLHNARGDYPLALETLRHAIALYPDDSNAHLALALNLLKHGNYEAGFQQYERRRQHKEQTQEGAVAEWQGEDLYGKTILLTSEQGLGDMIQFIRFATLLHNRGARLCLQTYPALHKLFAHAFPFLSLCSTAPSGEGSFDYQAPLMSLPAKLGLCRHDISGAPYLSALPEKIQQWQDFFSKETVNIGIVWQGNPSGLIDRGRSVPLRFFKALSDIDSVQLYSLQKNYGLDQFESLSGSMHIKRMPEHFDSGEAAFMDTLALMQQLDLVITSDTSIAHLGGACGCPTWVALKHNPDWRWWASDDKSLWYDSVRLFRQSRAGNWSEVFVAIAEAVRQTFKLR